MRIHFKTHTLKFRMTVVVVFLVFLATGLVAGAALYMVERQMHGVVGDQQYALVSSAAAHIDGGLNSKKNLLKNFSESLPQSVFQNAVEFQKFLESRSSLREEFFNVAVFDGAGNLIANLSDRRQIGKLNAASREYFRDTIRYREGVVSKPFRSAISGKPVILVTEPVSDDTGRVVFVIAGGIDLQAPNFFGQLESLKPGKTGYFSMMAGDGTIIHHPDKKLILLRAGSEVTRESAVRLSALKGGEGWTEGEPDRGVRALLSYKRLRNADGIIGAVYPVDEAFAPLAEIRKNALLATVVVAMLAGFLGWLAIWKLLLPLSWLQNNVAEISDGSANIEVFDVVHDDEFGELSRAFYALSQQRKLAEANLEALARTDALTGISNRRMFEEVFALAMSRADRTGNSLALAYLDIDHFKAINDTKGHATGDQVLVEFAKRLKQVVRQTDTIARLAGDEFVVLFEGLADDAEPAALAQKILDAMRPLFACESDSFAVTTSVGVAFKNNGGASLDDFLKAADDALYAAKKAGRNRYSVLCLGAEDVVAATAEL